jgi:hypothetical protein
MAESVLLSKTGGSGLSVMDWSRRGQRTAGSECRISGNIALGQLLKGGQKSCLTTTKAAHGLSGCVLS